jgi:hypothetical protein
MIPAFLTVRVKPLSLKKTKSRYMRIILTLALAISSSLSIGQVFNQGYGNTMFKNLLTNGITYIKTGNHFFDSVMVETLEDHWKISKFTTIERYKEPEENGTALFITSQKPIREHQQDRKNPRFITLMPSIFFYEGADYENDPVDMDKTVGYMYFNGFHDIIDENDEYRYLRMMIVSLNEGLTLIKEKQFTDVADVLNTNVNNAIIAKHKGLVGNTLIIHRDQTKRAIDIEKVKASGIRYRLLATDEYHNVLEKKDPSHYVLYFGENKYTELSLIRIENGEIIYTKHFPQEYVTIGKKEMKAILAYFK